MIAPREHRALEPQRNRLKIRRPDGGVAEEKDRRAGERVVVVRARTPLATRRVPSHGTDSSECGRSPDRQSVSPCVSCFTFSMKRSIDWATSGNSREATSIELRRHRRVVLGGDVDDAGDVADVAVVVCTVDGGNELVLGIVDVLVVLAVFVALVRFAVQERDDDRVFEPEVDRVAAAFDASASGTSDRASTDLPPVQSTRMSPGASIAMASSAVITLDVRRTVFPGRDRSAAQRALIVLSGTKPLRPVSEAATSDRRESTA